MNEGVIFNYTAKTYIDVLNKEEFLKYFCVDTYYIELVNASYFKYSKFRKFTTKHLASLFDKLINLTDIDKENFILYLYDFLNKEIQTLDKFFGFYVLDANGNVLAEFKSKFYYFHKTWKYSGGEIYYVGYVNEEEYELKKNKRQFIYKL